MRTMTRRIVMAMVITVCTLVSSVRTIVPEFLHGPQEGLSRVQLAPLDRLFPFQLVLLVQIQRCRYSVCVCVCVCV